MLDADLGLQIFRKAFSYFLYDPILPKRGLDENIKGKNDEQDGPNKPEQYFLEFLQGQFFIL